MKKTYQNPSVEVVALKAQEDILLNSDVDIDVESLYGDGILN